MNNFREEIDTYYKSIIEGGTKNYNNVLKLTKLYENYNNDLTQITDDNEEVLSNIRYLTHVLFKIYYKLATKLQLNPSMATNDKESILYKWLRKTYDINFKNKILIFYIENLEQENSFSLDCLDFFMKCIELEATFFASKMGAAYFPNKTMQKLIVALFKESKFDKSYLVKEFTETYYKKYADVQFYFQVEYQSLTESIETNLIPRNSVYNAGYWFALTNHDSNYDDNDSDLNIFVSNPPTLMENEFKFKKAFEQNWLFNLSNSLISDEQFKSILTILHKRVIPRLQQPTKLLDFLTDCYDNSNDLAVQLLALNGLFNLMHKYNLEYPNFYYKLYALFTEDLLHLKYRSRFIRLIDLFLRSTHLSINLVASFIKRMSRLLLTASPGAIVSILPLIYNLLKLHPNCMIMIHDPEYVPKNYALFDKVKDKKFMDPYDENEQDPELSDAINSSLWEIDTLMSHYHPNVASLSKIFKQPFRKLNYNLEDFLDWNYKTLLEHELKRKVKISPSLDFDVKTKGEKLFKKNEDADGTETYLNTINW
ncbi:CBF-domain-containing protein [Hanseniaspora valbyensis NRRL Y-1626]|uniref:CBF-domain-containing protein n=1 Tax=Hanseniaspora valbyensis NRRL Y-1626 TaxID=766949 RepID=A0A1B7TFY2_9ASCO|nr:CBF-domain-containing protein [Hanseniaspora valbyensis NRRL Y-1626]